MLEWKQNLGNMVDGDGILGGGISKAEAPESVPIFPFPYIISFT